MGKTTKRELKAEDLTVEDLRRQGPPQYITKKPKFSCPAAQEVAWHWGLMFKDCPLDSSERDMLECETCRLRGESCAKINKRRPPSRRESFEDRKGQEHGKGKRAERP